MLARQISQEGEDISAPVINDVVADIDQLLKGAIPPGLDIPALETLKRLGARIGNKVETLILSPDDYSITVTPDLMARIDIADGPDYSTYGSTIGRKNLLTHMAKLENFVCIPKYVLKGLHANFLLA